MRQWIRSVSVQIMACCLFGIKPLSKPMLVYSQLALRNRLQWNLQIQQNFDAHKCIWKHHLRNGSHAFCPGWDELNWKTDALLSDPLIFSHAKSFENVVCIMSGILGFIAKANILMDGYEEMVININRPLYIYSYSVDNVNEVSETVFSSRVWS